MAFEMITLKARLTFIEEILGTASNNPEIHSEYIASKAEDAMKIEEEVAAIGVEEVIEKSMTVFPRDEDGNPILWDYQIKGFFKDAAGCLRRVPGTKASKIKAFKKEIDGLLFVSPPHDPPEYALRAGHLRTSPQSCHRPGRADRAGQQRNRTRRYYHRHRDPVHDQGYVRAGQGVPGLRHPARHRPVAEQWQRQI